MGLLPPPSVLRAPAGLLGCGRNRRSFRHPTHTPPSLARCLSFRRAPRRGRQALAKAATVDTRRTPAVIDERGGPAWFTVRGSRSARIRRRRVLEVEGARVSTSTCPRASALWCLRRHVLRPLWEVRPDHQVRAGLASDLGWVGARVVDDADRVEGTPRLEQVCPRGLPAPFHFRGLDVGGRLRERAFVRA